MNIPPLHPLDNDDRWKWHRWFAWRPVMLDDGDWVWFRDVDRVMEGGTDGEGSDWGWGYRAATQEALPRDYARDLTPLVVAAWIISSFLYPPLVFAGIVGGIAYLVLMFIGADQKSARRRK